MRVFLSWSGDLSRAAARAVRDLLGLVLQHVDVVSIDDAITPGAEWHQESTRFIKEADCAVATLTAANINNRWVSFEAGALWARGTPYVPLLVDISLVDLPFPFAQFQAYTLSREDMYRFVTHLNQQGYLGIPDSVVRDQFRRVWPQLEAQFSAITRVGTQEPSAEPPLLQSSRDADEVLKKLKEIEAALRELAKPRDGA